MWWIIRKIITHLTAQNVSKLGIISPHYYGIDVYRFPATIHRVNIHAYTSIWGWLSDISVDRSSTHNVCWHIRRIVRLILDGGKPPISLFSAWSVCHYSSQRICTELSDTVSRCNMISSSGYEHVIGMSYSLMHRLSKPSYHTSWG